MPDTPKIPKEFVHAEPPTAPGTYLRLFHGRSDPSVILNTWGTDGPCIGPLESIQVTYLTSLRVGLPGFGATFTVELCDDMAFYDGMYYGDWSVDVIDAPKADSKLQEYWVISFPYDDDWHIDSNCYAAVDASDAVRQFIDGTIEQQHDPQDFDDPDEREADLLAVRERAEELVDIVIRGTLAPI